MAQYPNFCSALQLKITNVISRFSANCNLNLHEIAQNCANVEYTPTNKFVTMKIRKPNATANIWASGKIVCLGTTNKNDAKIACRRFARLIQKVGFRVHISRLRIALMFGSTKVPFKVNTEKMANMFKDDIFGIKKQRCIIWDLKDFDAVANIYSSGCINISAHSEVQLRNAIEYIGSIIVQFRV